MTVRHRQANDVKSHGKSQRESCPAGFSRGEVVVVVIEDATLMRVGVCVCVGDEHCQKPNPPPSRPTSAASPLPPSAHHRPWLIINGGHCCMDFDVDVGVATCWKCKQRWQRSLKRLRWKQISTRSFVARSVARGPWAVGGCATAFIQIINDSKWRLTNDCESNGQFARNASAWSWSNSGEICTYGKSALFHLGSWEICALILLNFLSL